MDMGPSYQKSVRDCLPNADIVFDRFHVMKNYSKALSNQRRIEFRKANMASKKLQARLLWQAMRKLTGVIKYTNCLVILINQIRMKIVVMFGSEQAEDIKDKARRSRFMQYRGFNLIFRPPAF